MADLSERIRNEATALERAIKGGSKVGILTAARYLRQCADDAERLAKTWDKPTD